MTQYRKDIDGLRAVAILPVVLFHAGFHNWSGGFVGVDIFFVISGYLITSIIFTSYEANRFSFTQFYERRIRRLLPPLVPVLLFTFLFAYKYFHLDEFKSFSRSLFANSLFLSNWHFLAESGYFGVDSEFKPLLHTWSLSIEEQFYVFFPALLILTLRNFKRHYRSIILALLLGSLSFSQWLVQTGNSDAAFFNTLSRIWEILFGSLIALTSWQTINSKYNFLLRISGLSLIGISIFSIDEKSHFPGVLALVPTLGCALVIIAQNQSKDLLYSFLSSRPMVYIGQRSYAIYLWHWPVFVFIKYHFEEPNDGHRAAGILVVLLLSELSLRLLENPFRAGHVMGLRKTIFSAAIVSTALFLIISLYGFKEGFSKRDVVQITRGITDFPIFQRTPLRKCFFDPAHLGKYGDFDNIAELGCRTNVSSTSKYKVGVYGDSHAGAVVPALIEAAEKADVPMVYFSYVGCPSLFGVEWTKQQNANCRKFNQSVFDQFQREDVTHVILVSRWNMYYDELIDRKQRPVEFEAALENTVRIFSKKFKVIVVAPVPQPLRSIPRDLARRMIQGKSVEDLHIDKNKFLAQNKRFNAVAVKFRQNPNVRVMDYQDIFCDNLKCSVHLGGKTLYKDGDHLSDLGVAMLGRPFFELLQARELIK